MTTHTNKEREAKASLSLLANGNGTRTHLNADVRWTSACRQLDGGNTIIFFPRKEERKCKSCPVVRTISSVHNGFALWTLDFLFQQIRPDETEFSLQIPCPLCCEAILTIYICILKIGFNRKTAMERWETKWKTNCLSTK